MEKHVYVNEQTGAVIETPCLCAGDQWRELVSHKAEKKPGKGAKNGELRDNGGSTDTVA